VELRTDQVLVAANGSLDEVAPAVAGGLLPGHSALFGDQPDVAVPRGLGSRIVGARHRRNASAGRKARWKTSRNVSTSSTARSEYRGCPPGVLRRGACQPAKAASSSQNVRSARRRSPAS